MTKDTNTFCKNLALFAVSIVLSTILAEFTLRLVLPPPVIWKFPQEHYIYDPEIGHWLKPDQQAFTHDKTVITNSFGIRDSEYSTQARSGVYRIVALGDSQTFGNGLELKDTWPKQLEHILNQSNSTIRYEVLNSGLPASDTWQHEIILERTIFKYHPDAVVLAFYVNDVVNRFTPRNFMRKTDNQLITRIIYAAKQSVLLLTIREAFHIIRQSLASAGADLVQQSLLKGENRFAFKERWGQVEESLSAMKKLADSHNVAFMVASLPRRDQVDGRLSWGAYNKHLQAITARYEIPFLSMQEPLQRGYEKHKGELFIPWDGHNSEIANHIIAQEISRAMFVTSP